jgi:hypothetical protein
VTVRATISLPTDLSELAKSRSESFGLNFSEYVQLLIREDLRSGRKKITLVAETPKSTSPPRGNGSPVSYRKGKKKLGS